EELEVDLTGTIIVMIGKVWDVNAVTGHYLSTYLVVSDSRCMVLFTLGSRSLLCKYMLKVVVADDTAHTIIVMFNEIATKLLKCSVESLLGAGEDEDDESSLPTTIRNLIGTTHVLEIKSHTYYEYGTFESFTCWKINPSEMVDDGASFSSQPLSADNPNLTMKRLSRHPSVYTPSKHTKEKKKKRTELEDSNVNEIYGSVKDSDKCNADGALNKKKKMRPVDQSRNGHIPTLSFADLLQNSIRIHSDTTIKQDGRVQSYCGLRLTKTTVGCSGPLHLRLAKKATKKLHSPPQVGAGVSGESSGSGVRVVEKWGRKLGEVGGKV
nr:hypothetical protein [Tanacetum cinerariifolium]